MLYAIRDNNGKFYNAFSNGWVKTIVFDCLYEHGIREAKATAKELRNDGHPCEVVGVEFTVKEV